MNSETMNWTPSGNKIKTKWGKNLDPKKVWNEYPRPQLERKDWLNLNGFWSYSITDINSGKPVKFDGKILVPFCVESSLSGVMKSLNEKQILWYFKEFEIPKEWKDKNIIIHFNAVDWKCELFINDIKVGEHFGGYSEFNFDITKYLKEGINKITLKVLDPSDKGYQPIGKQCLDPQVIWYTSVSGIWQTVWIEPVNDLYIKNIEINNDYDNKEIKINCKVNENEKFPLEISLIYKEKEIIILKGYSNENIIFKIPEQNFYPWCPNEPNLYRIKANLFDKTNKLKDSILSYTTIRKIEQRKDENGYYRIYLNNKPIFNMGTLDQGYWPDGLYTPPSEEAMIYDINKLKELGFNTIRKHVKVEPYKYYYYCDIIGMLIWQDMPSGDRQENKWEHHYLNAGEDAKRSEESKNNYYKEWEEIINIRI